MRIMTKALMAALGASLIAGASFAANTSSSGQTQLNKADNVFLENAIQGSYAEVQGSKLAQEKTSDADVKEFAAAMIKDHTAMIEEASALAKSKGYEPPTEPSVMQRTELVALRALSGGAFDTMYVDRIGVASHEATIKQFETASQEAEDADVKAMAQKTLPKLRHHLEMAQALNQKQKAK
jgi:putative membrane protein